MSLSHAEIAAVVTALERALPAATCQAARAVRGCPHAILLKMRAPGHTHLLLLSAERGASRIHRVARAPTQPERPSAFVMLLRKHLVGARLLTLALHDDDRILRLVFDRGPAGHLHLVAELTGHHGNLFLLDEDDRLLGALRRDTSRDRALTVGGEYRPPAPPPRIGTRLRDGLPTEAPEPFLEEAYATLLQGDGLDQRRRALKQRLRAASKRARRRARALAHDQGRDPEAHKRTGDLLQQAWGRVERGASSVDVIDVYDPAQPAVTVPLDPALDLRENIDRAYARYKRYARGAETVAARARETDAALARIDALTRALDDAEDEEAIAELERRADAERDVASARQQTPKRERAAPRTPYHRFASSDGIDILVGRTSRDNDALTFHVARGNDLWLHASDVPGSHVIVRTPRSAALPRATLEEAALLAAHYSKARSDGVVTVRYTERKHLRKPKGAGPGRVSLAGGKTLDVRTDDPRLDALFRRRESAG